MTAVVPLEALVARADRVSGMTAPQYDSIPGGDRYAYAAERPDNFVNITLSASDFPAPAPGRLVVYRGFSARPCWLQLAIRLGYHRCVGERQPIKSLVDSTRALQNGSKIFYDGIL